MVLVTFEQVSTLLANPPTLAPRPNSTNIRTFEVWFFEKLEGIPSKQSDEFGYKGMAQQVLEYALDSNQPWQDFPSVGDHRIADGSLTANQQRDADAIWNAATICYDSQQNVKRACIGCLNEAVPKKYKRTNGIGTTSYKINQDIREILANLRDTYGVPTPNEKTLNKQLFAQGWASAIEPIESLIDRLENCYVQSIFMQPPYTMLQVINKAKSAVQRSGLYSTAMLKWNAANTVNQTWPEFKQHFVEAYDNRMRTGAGTMGDEGYHGAANVDGGDYPDDDSLQSIMQSVQNMHLSNNAATQQTNDTVSTLATSMASIQQALLATQQQLALLTQGGMTNTGGWQATPPIPAYIQPTNPAPPPAGYDNRRGGGGRVRGGSRRQGGRGRGGTGAAAPQAVVPVPNACGAIPPPAGGATNANAFKSNTTKHYNNWNYCYTCGWDVPTWHNSSTCPANYRKNGHQEGCTRVNFDAYLAAGHRPSKAAKQKTTLPTNPQAHQA